MCNYPIPKLPDWLEERVPDQINRETRETDGGKCAVFESRSSESGELTDKERKSKTIFMSRF